MMRKQAKSRHILYRLDGIVSDDDATQILCAHNIGLDNGVSREDVMKIFKDSEDLEEVIMLPQKPYCFLCFRNSDTAEKIKNEMNGRDVILNDADEKQRKTITLYLSFVAEVPQSLMPSTKLPPGLILIEDFVSEDYERQLLSQICFSDSDTALKHRRVKHYGFEFKYGTNSVDPDEPLDDKIPVICDEMLEKALKAGLVMYKPDQLTINEYQPGQGIPPHIDTPPAFEDGIMSLSLGSQVLMEFRHPDGQHLSVLLPRRSLLVMTKDSRYEWSHGITPRKSDIVSSGDSGLTLLKRGMRTSFTFRKLAIKKGHPGELTGASNIPLTEEEAIQVEEQHVYKVYNEIADHFSSTRHTPWPRVSEFILEQPPGTLMADIGCGNGKYLKINEHCYKIGSDRCEGLATICQERDCQILVSDILSIPFRSNSFDICICIAVVHHLSTEQRRINAINELLRILKPAGKVLIYVWAMEQELHKVKSKYLKEKKFQGEAANQEDGVLKPLEPKPKCGTMLKNSKFESNQGKDIFRRGIPPASDCSSLSISTSCESSSNTSDQESSYKVHSVSSSSLFSSVESRAESTSDISPVSFPSCDDVSTSSIGEGSEMESSSRTVSYIKYVPDISSSSDSDVSATLHSSGYSKTSSFGDDTCSEVSSSFDIHSNTKSMANRHGSVIKGENVKPGITDFTTSDVCSPSETVSSCTSSRPSMSSTFETNCNSEVSSSSGVFNGIKRSRPGWSGTPFEASSSSEVSSSSDLGDDLRIWNNRFENSTNDTEATSEVSSTSDTCPFQSMLHPQTEIFSTLNNNKSRNDFRDVECTMKESLHSEHSCTQSVINQKEPEAEKSECHHVPNASSTESTSTGFISDISPMANPSSADSYLFGTSSSGISHTSSKLYPSSNSTPEQVSASIPASESSNDECNFNQTFPLSAQMESLCISNDKVKLGSKNESSSSISSFCHSLMSPSDYESSSDTFSKDNSTCSSASNISGQSSEKLQIHVNRTEFKKQDLLVPWQLKKKSKGMCDSVKDSSETNNSEKRFHRYYHVFKQGELETLCRKCSDCDIVKSYYDQGNWCVILQKR